MEKKAEHEMDTLGPFKRAYRHSTPIMENQLEKHMEHEMKTGVIRGLKELCVSTAYAAPEFRV